MLKATPAVVLAGALTLKWLAAAGLTMIPDSLPVMVLVTVSVAVIAWVPAVFRVMLKLWTPASPAVNV